MLEAETQEVAEITEGSELLTDARSLGSEVVSTGREIARLVDEIGLSHDSEQIGEEVEQIARDLVEVIKEEKESRANHASNFVPLETIPTMFQDGASYYDEEKNEVHVSTTSAADLIDNSVKLVTDVWIDVNPENNSEFFEKFQKIRQVTHNTNIPHAFIQNQNYERYYLTLSDAKLIGNNQELMSLLPGRARYEIKSMLGKQEADIDKKWTDFGESGFTARDIRETIQNETQKLIVQNPDEEHRSEVHELTHYMDMGVRSSEGRNIQLLYNQIQQNLANDAWVRSQSENLPLITEFLRGNKEILGLAEAEASLHELFNQNYIVDSSKFSESSMAFRLLGLLSWYKNNPRSGLSLAEEKMNDIMNPTSEDVWNNIDEHDIGTLVLLFGNKIIRDGKLDLYAILPQDSEMSAREVAKIVLQRIIEVSQDPQKYAQEIVESKVLDDIISSLQAVRTAKKPLVDQVKEKLQINSN